MLHIVYTNFGFIIEQIIFHKLKDGESDTVNFQFQGAGGDLGLFTLLYPSCVRISFAASWYLVLVLSTFSTLIILETF